MASLLPTGRSFGATLVVILGCWLFGGQTVQAGCGDHGYIVQRDKGDVVVVTPSNPKCPCKGPKCQKQETPSGPMVPVAPVPVPVDEAWNINQATDHSLLPIKLEYHSPQSNPLSGYPDDILQPPRQ